MTDRTRRARGGAGVRRARLEGGKRSGAGRTPRLKAGQARLLAAQVNIDLRGENAIATDVSEFIGEIRLKYCNPCSIRVEPSLLAWCNGLRWV